MAIVYQHRRLDTNDIFYIGIGKENKRAYSTHDRSNLWKKITNKSDYLVEIILNDLSWEEAIECEKYLIKYYGRKDLGLGPLANLTDGGEGMLGHKQTAETIAKRVKHLIGHVTSDETKQKIGQPQVGSGNHYAKKIINIETNEVYDCVKDAAIAYGINYGTLRRQLSTKIFKTPLRYKQDE